MSLLICKVKNGYTITDTNNNCYVAKGWYDITDVVKEYFISREEE